MTVRSFEADELVQLPRMTTTDSMALATALLTRAAAVPELPPAIARARGRMQQALDRVHESAESRVQERGQSDAKDPANRALDATWASLRWWSKAWTLLPHPEHASQADTGRMLETVLFPDGLRFTQLAFRDQWVESQSRLGLIEKEGLEPVITGLGGGSILAAVRRAHDDFGRAMGFTDPNDETPSAVLMRERRDELKSAMRRYVLVVMAHVDSDDPADAVLADSLLLPIKTWKPRTPAVPATGEPGETPPATEPPAADPPATPAG